MLTVDHNLQTEKACITMEDLKTLKQNQTFLPHDDDERMRFCANGYFDMSWFVACFAPSGLFSSRLSDNLKPKNTTNAIEIDIFCEYSLYFLSFDFKSYKTIFLETSVKKEANYSRK